MTVDVEALHTLTDSWILATGKIMPYLFPDYDITQLQLCVRVDIVNGSHYAHTRTGFSYQGEDVLIPYKNTFTAHECLETLEIFKDHNLSSNGHPSDTLINTLQKIVVGISSFLTGDTYDVYGNVTNTPDPERPTFWSTALLSIYVTFDADGLPIETSFAIDGLIPQRNNVYVIRSSLDCFLEAIAPHTNATALEKEQNPGLLVPSS